MPTNVEYFESLNLNALPESARDFIENEIISDTEGLNALNEENETLAELKLLISEKYPEAIGGAKPEDVAVEMTPEEEKEFIINKLEVLKMLVDDLEGEEKETIEMKIDILQDIVNEYADGGNVENDAIQKDFMEKGGKINNKWSSLNSDGKEEIITELNKFFIEKTKQQAKDIFSKGEQQVFGIDYSGSESTINDESEFDGFEMFAVEKKSMEKGGDVNPVPFLNDEEKMEDFKTMSKSDFLNSYSYITEAEYDATFDEFFKDKDLFDYYDAIPEQVQDVLGDYSEDGDYEDTAEMLRRVEELGYTFDYYLDNQPYALRKKGIPLSQIQGFEESSED